MRARRSDETGRTLTAASIVLLVMSAALLEARSFDLWWHMETGKQILSSWTIPRADDFSFTSQGAPWIDHEWLFQIVLYLAYRFLGSFGFTLIKATCAGGVAIIGYTAMRRAGATRDLAAALVAAALLGMRFRLAERPETATLLMAAATAALLVDLVVRPARPARRLAGLALVCILWVNLHAGALLAPALAAAAAAGAAVQRLLVSPATGREARAGLVNAASATAICGLGILFNPFGYRVYTVPFGIARALAPRNLVNPEWTFPSIGVFPLLYVCLAGGLGVALAAMMRKRAASWCRAAMFLLAGSMALTAVRHVGLLFAVMPVVLDPTPLSRASRLLPRRAGPVVCLAVAAGMAVWPPSGTSVGIGIQQGRFPRRAAGYLNRHLHDARLYNDVRFGGYLIWSGYPARRVFIDGRNEVHEKLLGELSRALDDGRMWKELMDRYRIDGAVVSYRPSGITLRDGSRSSFSETHFPRRFWALVYWDDVAMVFARRDARHAGLIASDEYRRVRPEAFALRLPETEHPAPDPLLMQEIRRKLREDPGCVLAKSMRSVYRTVGDAFDP